MKNLRGPQRNKNVVVQNRERQRAAMCPQNRMKVVG